MDSGVLRAHVNKPKYSVIDCIVSGHRDYGVLVSVPASGEVGYIDRSEIGNSGMPQSEWPSEGSGVRCVLLGYTRDGRLRLSSRPRDVDLAETVPDLAGALRHWIAVRDAGVADEGAMSQFLGSSYAIPVLRWAMRDRPTSDNYKAAQRAVPLLPPGADEEL